MAPIFRFPKSLAGDWGKLKLQKRYFSNFQGPTINYNVTNIMQSMAIWFFKSGSNG